MEEAALRIFKGKFVVLTVILNLVILLLAGAVLAYFMLGPEINLPVSGILCIVALVLFTYFWKQYRKEKEWLDAHA